MNHTLEKIDKTVWFTADRQYAILKAFGQKKFWIGKLTIQPEKDVLWRVD